MNNRNLNGSENAQTVSSPAGRRVGVPLTPLNQSALEPTIDAVQDHLEADTGFAASVVIVAYNTNIELLRCLDSLSVQSIPHFETLVVDNGKNDAIYGELCRYPIKYIRLKQNFRPSLARNVGIVHARAPFVCFLDDDAIADRDFVAQHVACLTTGALGVRGRIVPKTGSFYNGLAYHYDLGPNSVPSYVDMENNASFPRQVLIDIGGFNPYVFAGEGAELSYRIVRSFGGHDRLVYHPAAVVYHDYSTSLKKLLRKTLRGARMYVCLDRDYPDFWGFVESYHPLPWGGVHRPQNLWDRGRLAVLRRALPPFTTATRAWYARQLDRQS